MFLNLLIIIGNDIFFTYCAAMVTGKEKAIHQCGLISSRFKEMAALFCNCVWLEAEYSRNLVWWYWNCQQIPILLHCEVKNRCYRGSKCYGRVLKSYWLTQVLFSSQFLQKHGPLCSENNDSWIIDWIWWKLDVLFLLTEDIPSVPHVAPLDLCEYCFHRGEDCGTLLVRICHVDRAVGVEGVQVV